MISKFSHHSVADWDFALPPTRYNLDNTRFVSPPTSLRTYHVGGGSAYHTVLCRVPSTLCLPEGEIRTWRWHILHIGNLFTFRNQAALGTADYLNCYLILVSTTNTLLRRYVGGGPTDYGMGPGGCLPSTWQHYRVLYWNGTNPAGDEALNVELYLEVTGNWVKQGNTGYDTANLYKDSATNRSGLVPQVRDPEFAWHDDTEIWGPA
ncbi:hypothetical protein ES703_85847 [subsurface metagenome]